MYSIVQSVTHDHVITHELDQCYIYASGRHQKLKMHFNNPVFKVFKMAEHCFHCVFFFFFKLQCRKFLL